MRCHPIGDLRPAASVVGRRVMSATPPGEFDTAWSRRRRRGDRERAAERRHSFADGRESDVTVEHRLADPAVGDAAAVIGDLEDHAITRRT